MKKKTNIQSMLVAEAVGALSLVCSCLLSWSSLFPLCCLCLCWCCLHHSHVPLGCLHLLLWGHLTSADDITLSLASDITKSHNYSQLRSYMNYYDCASYSDHYTQATIELYTMQSMACDLAILTYPQHPWTYLLSSNISSRS